MTERHPLDPPAMAAYMAYKDYHDKTLADMGMPILLPNLNWSELPAKARERWRAVADAVLMVTDLSRQPKIPAQATQLDESYQGLVGAKKKIFIQFILDRITERDALATELIESTSELWISGEAVWSDHKEGERVQRENDVYRALLEIHENLWWGCMVCDRDHETGDDPRPICLTVQALGKLFDQHPDYKASGGK